MEPQTSTNLSRRHFLSLASLCVTSAAVAADQPASKRQLEYQLFGDYHNLTTNLRQGSGVPATLHEVHRLDAQINFAWGPHGPFGEGGRIGPRFAVRWSGFLHIPEAGVYTFHLNHTGIAQLSVEQQRLYSGMQYGLVVGAFATRAFSKDAWVPFELICANRQNRSFASLEWSMPGSSQRALIGPQYFAHLPE